MTNKVVFNLLWTSAKLTPNVIPGSNIRLVLSLMDYWKFALTSNTGQVSTKCWCEALIHCRDSTYSQRHWLKLFFIFEIKQQLMSPQLQHLDKMHEEFRMTLCGVGFQISLCCVVWAEHLLLWCLVTKTYWSQVHYNGKQNIPNGKIRHNCERGSCHTLLYSQRRSQRRFQLGIGQWWEEKIFTSL